MSAPDETWSAGTTLGAPITTSLETVAQLPEIRLAGEHEAPNLELGAVLGQGAVGVVLEGRQLGLARAVAVKAPRGDRTDGTAAASIVREARIAGDLEHPNILPVHALGRDAGGRPLVVMPKVDGASWRALLAQAEHPLWAGFDGDDLGRNLQVLMQVCRAVHLAHRRGVLHRDLKPDNVLIGPEGQVYLVDWGLAVRLTDDPRTEAVMGTPGYMPPEMFTVGARVDARSDVYLLGATLHEVLAGARLHGGKSLAEVAARAQDPAPYAPPAGVPPALAAVVQRACHVEPAQRFPDVEAFRQALADFQVHRAALSLIERTEAELARLEAAPDDHSREALFGACRFGFGEALRMWPQSARAQAGLARAVGLLIERELDRGAPDAARRLLAELPDPRPDLAAKVEAALAAADAERARLAALEAEARSRDAAYGGRWRAAQFGALWLLFVIGPVAVGLVRASGRLPAEPPPLARAVLPLAMWVVLLLWMRVRASMLPQGFDRRLALAVGGALLALGSAWLGAAIIQAPFAAGLLVTPAVLGAMSAGLAVALDRRFWAVAAVYALSAPALAFASRWLLGEVVIGVANGVVLALNMRWMALSRSRAPSAGP